LLYNRNGDFPGAQAEHRGDAGPVRVLLRGSAAPAGSSKTSNLSTG
jgi:hypothetical protein